MTIWSFLTGFILGILPLLAYFHFFRGKLLFIENPYIKGPLLGFLLWVILNGFIYLKNMYSLFGLFSGAEGFGSILIVTSSLQGFLTAGLVAAFISVKMAKKRASKS